MTTLANPTLGSSCLLLLALLSLFHSMEASEAVMKPPGSVTTPPPQAAQPAVTDATKRKTLNVCVMVEPSPLTYVCGYANRFQELLKHLSSETDAVQIVTAEVVDKSPPTMHLEFPVHYTCGYQMPKYPSLSLSCDFTAKALRTVLKQRPDLIHVSSPGLMVWGAAFAARVFQIPLFISYHTHMPVYVRSYLPHFLGFNKFMEWLAWQTIRMAHSCADCTVVTSPQIQAEFVAHGVPRVQVWQKGIDSERFHPRFKDAAMRERLTDGNPQDLLLVHIGRIAHEKRIHDLKDVLARFPEARLAIVGAGPALEFLKKHFAGTKTVFTGMLSGTELSQAFASGDIFLMPSDSETLGFVVLESQASGVPVIGAAAGGVQDLIEHEVTGYLCPPGDTDAVCARIVQWRDDPALRQKMARRARAEMEKWTWQGSMAKLRNEQYRAALEHFPNRWERRLARILFFWKRKKTHPFVE